MSDSENAMLVVAVVTTAISLFSAVAAFRSADAAQSTLRETQDAEVRSQRRSAKRAANELVAETQQIQTLFLELVRGLETVGALAGRRGEWFTPILEQFSVHSPALVEFQTQAREFLEGAELCENKLAGELEQLEARLIQVGRIKSDLLRQLETTNEEMRMLRASNGT